METHLIVQCRGGGGFVLDVVEMVLTDIAQNRVNGILTNKEFGKKFYEIHGLKFTRKQNSY